MVQVNGTKATFGDNIYEFPSQEDAEAFAECVKKTGQPKSCAEKHNCIRKTTISRERDQGLSM